MKTVATENALGMVLAHDHTRIVGTEFKGVQFKKGHIIREEDIPVLLDMGKNSIYVLELSPNLLHENAAAEVLANLVYGKNTRLAPPQEGKVNIYATQQGFLKINQELLLELNLLDNIALSTLPNHIPVSENKLLASVKIIPLALEKSILEKARKISSEPIISVAALSPKKAGLIITGSEVFYKRIEDKFAPILTKKLQDLCCSVEHIRFAPDDKEIIKSHINELATQCDVIISSGGMSVDPDDVSPHAIRECATSVVTYGTPVMPGAMFMLAYKNNVPILGVPACGMFSKITVLDIILPKVLLNETITKRDIASLGMGGLCQACSVCHYPNCSFC